jgi:hypothetical protein
MKEENFYDIFEEILQDASDDILTRLHALTSERLTAMERASAARGLYDRLEAAVDQEMRYRDL